jgi:hypothetical protein
MTVDHAVTSATGLHVHPLAMTADHAVMPAIGHHVRTLVTDLRVQALEIAQRVHRLAIDLQGQALVIVQGRALVIDHLAQAAERVAAASASSVDPDQAAAAPVDQRSSVLSADHKNILSNTFRQDVFPFIGINLATIQSIMFTSLRSRLLQDSDQVCDDAFVLALDETIADAGVAADALQQGFALAARLMRRKYAMMQAVVILPDAVFDVDYLKLAEHAFGADHDHLIVISIKTNSSQNISQQIARGAEYCSPNASIRGVVSRQQPGYVLATVSTGASTTKTFLSSRKAA